MIQKLKKSNAGFTLVELIVVIAILGVLAAVLVPQYIKYVDKSRAATDQSALGELLHAVEISSSGQATIPTGTIVLTNTSGTITYAAGASASTNVATIVSEVNKIVGTSIVMKSVKGKALTAADLLITFDANGKPTYGSQTNIDAITTIS